MVGDTARDRFVAAAARLFADRGYARTSVADIQAACGLTTGSGALYKHFRSKSDLLEAVVDSHVTTMRDGARWFVDALPDDLDEALRRTAEAVLDAIHRDRDAVRVMLRELDEFPELRARMWDEIDGCVYAPFAAWLAGRAERDGPAAADPQATATVLVAALTSVPLMETLTGRGPGDPERARFVDAWVRTARAALARR